MPAIRKLLSTAADKSWREVRSFMNWKKFMAEYREVREWLERQGVADAGACMLKILALLLAGHREPSDIVRRSVHSGPLQDILAEPWTELAPEFVVPEKIQKLLLHWTVTVPAQDVTLLGKIHERTCSARKTQGVYYTPEPIVDFIMDHTLACLDVIQNPDAKILDPACGCGFFLIKAYDVLFVKFRAARSSLQQRYADRDWSDEGIHRQIIGKNIWGADIDSQAAAIACLSLRLRLPKASHSLPVNVIVFDSLRRPEDCAEFPAALREFWTADYACVIGNPPYVSFGMRGAGRLEAAYRDYLRQAYAATAEYKLSYYALFLQRGIELLQTGGRLGFIVPDSFLLGRYYSKIRKYILDNTAIERLAHIAASVFKSASTGYFTIVILQKGKAGATHQSRIVKIDDMKGLQPDRVACQYEQSYFGKQPHYRFRIFFDLKIKQIIDKLDEIGRPLRHFASGHTGIRSLSKQADIVGKAARGVTWRRGLVSGGQLSRYGIRYEGHWLNIDETKLYKGGWRPDVVQQYKILVRQTGYTLTACTDPDGYYHLNNIHSFVANGRISADYLLILLNSRLLSFYYHAVSVEYGRAMAQTDIESLECLPVIVNGEINEQAPELVRTMLDCVKRRGQGDPAAASQAQALDDYFNQLVYKIYGLTDAEVALIEAYEAALLTKRSVKKQGVR